MSRVPPSYYDAVLPDPGEVQRLRIEVHRLREEVAHLTAENAQLRAKSPGPNPDLHYLDRYH